MLKLYLIFIFNLICGGRAESKESFLLRTQSLPEDLNLLPSLSNGHLGYTVFGNAIFMNGIYNGATGNSRRARIPNWLNINAELCVSAGCLDSRQANTSYEMNLYDGYFRYKSSYADLGITLEQRTYPHRFYNRALVYEVLAVRDVRDSNSSQFLKLTQHEGSLSDAFDFDVLHEGGSAAADYRLVRGRTKVLEEDKFQTKPHEIYVVYSESLEQPLQLNWSSSQVQLQHRVIICMDRQRAVAVKELQDVLQLEEAALLQSHINVWHEFWQQKFSIEIMGNALELARIVNAGIFYLASSLPALESHQPNDPYYGLSPTGLARGNLDADYEGHNFWDTEIWMLPVVTQFDFAYAKQLLEYRFNHLEAARYNANLTGYKGARFPWESAYTGTEVTNPCCPEIAQQEIHISPDIVFGLQQLFAQSNDTDWLCSRAYPIAAAVAEFLVSRATCEQATNACHLQHVMGPDEDHANVDDSVYTNAVAKIALDFAAWASGVCAADNASAVVWRQLKDRLVILHDSELNYHPQHVGYKLHDTVKQADTILLGYPLQFDNSATHLNDLRYYADATRESGPAMTWSMFAANYLATEEHWRADAYFARGYQSYVRPEFKVWSETPIGYNGSANFLTGIGGFLHALIFGYGGLNFARLDSQAQLQLRPGHVPPNVQQVLIKNIQFVSSKCNLEFHDVFSTLACNNAGNQCFELTQGNQRKLLGSNFTVTINKGDAPIFISPVNN